MSIKRLPKEVLDLFPRWSYQCPKCGKQYDETVQACNQCGTVYDESKWRVPPSFLKSHEAMSEYAHKVLAPKLTQKQRELLFHYFTELFSDGFEGGNFDLWTNTFGSPTVVENPVFDGSYAAEFYAASDWDSHYLRKSSGISGNPWHVRFYMRIENLPSSGDEFRFLRCLDTGWTQLYEVKIKNISGTLKLWINRTRPSSVTTDYNFSFQADTWYCIEVGFYAHSSEGYYKVYIDGNEVIDDGSLDTSGNNAGILDLGLSGGNTYHPVTIQIDSVIVADTYIGPEEEEEPPAGAEAGFETGDTSEFDGTPESNGTVTATSDAPGAHHGNYYCKCDINANGSAYAEGFFDIAEQQPVYCRGYFRFNQLPETDRDYTIISFEDTDGPTTVGYVQLVDDGGTKKWKMRRTTGGGATYATSELSIPDVDVWVCVEFAHGENLAKLWVDGDELLTHNDATDQTIDRVHVGACDSDIDADDTLEIHIDCIVVTDSYIGPENDLEVNNLTVNNSLTIWAPDDTNWIDLQTILIGSNPIFHIDQGVMGKKDIFCLGFLGSESPTRLVFGDQGYTNCTPSDIGKPVQKTGDAEPLPNTVLADYDNLNRKWWLSRPHSITNGSTMTIVGGTGTGTTNANSEATGGGAIQIGQGFEYEDEPPRINLTDNGDHVLCITAGSTWVYDEHGNPLYYQGVDPVLANMKLDTLNCNLIAYNDGKTRLARMDDGVLAVQSLVGDTWFAGTLDASNVFVDHINSLSAQGITIFDPTLYFGTEQDTNLYRSAANTLKTDDDFICSTLTANKVSNVASELVLDSPVAIETLRKVRINPETDDPVLELKKNDAERVFLGHNGTSTFLSSRLGDLHLGSVDTDKTVVDGDLEVTGEIAGQFSQVVADKGSDTTAGNGEKTVTFNESFDSAPLVFVQSLDPSARGVRFDVVSVSTNQFTVKSTLHRHKIGAIGASGTGAHHDHTVNITYTSGQASSGHTHKYVDYYSEGGTAGVRTFYSQNAVGAAKGVVLETQDTSDLYTFDGGDDHTHTKNVEGTTEPTQISPYIRALDLRNIGGTSEICGAVLINSNEPSVDLWTEVDNQASCRIGVAANFMWFAVEA
jgi:hypothetical protein